MGSVKRVESQICGFVTQRQLQWRLSEWKWQLQPSLKKEVAFNRKEKNERILLYFLQIPQVKKQSFATKAN